MRRFEFERVGDYVTIESLLDWVRQHPLKDGRIIPTIIWGGFGVGKCVIGSTPVVCNGYLVDIETLWEEHRGEAVETDGLGFWAKPLEEILVPAIDSQGAMTLAPVDRLYAQRVRELGRRVVLDDGSKIVMTKAHRVLGPAGWQREISAGDRVCVPSTLPWPQGKSIDPDLITLVAWQVSEGHEGTHSHLAIYQKDAETLRRARACALRWSEKSGVSLNSMPIVPDGRRDVSRLLITSVAYQRWLEDSGYSWGNRNAAKRLPNWLVSADDESLRVFLREYVAAEGSVNREPAAIELPSASEELANQLQLMFRRFGIWLRVSKRMKRATNGSGIFRPYYMGLISGSSLPRFASAIGIEHATKSAALDKLIAARENFKRSENTNTEGIPISDLLQKAQGVSGLPARRLGRLGVDRRCLAGAQNASRRSGAAAAEALRSVADGSAGEDFDQSSFASQNHPAATQIRKAFDNLDVEQIVGLAEAVAERVEREAFYATVVSVEDVWLDEWVYDLEVSGHHNYIAGGIITHNTQQIKAYGRSRDIEVRTYHPAHNVTGADIVGKAYHDLETNETHHALPEWLPTEADAPEGVLFIDELNRAPQEVLAGLMEPLGEGTISQANWTLPKGWNIIAAANPSEMGYMVQELDEAMVDRMIHYAPGWDARHWGRWAEGVGLNERIVDFALRHQNGLVEIGESQLPLEIDNKLRCTPRTLEYMGFLFEEGMPEGLLRVISQGLMGAAAGSAFLDDLEGDQPLRAEQILVEPVADANGRAAYAYDQQVLVWQEDPLQGEELIAASVERMVVRLLSTECLSPDPHKNRTAVLAGRFLAFIPQHLRAVGLASIARSAPEWYQPIEQATLGWAPQLVRQRHLSAGAPQLPAGG